MVATVYLCLKFCTCVSVAAFNFQQNVIKTMMQVENTFHSLAERRRQNVLLICDRGVMDGSACEFSLSLLFLLSVTCLWCRNESCEALPGTNCAMQLFSSPG